MYYEHYTIGGELYHHGILGQKWGDRNGPPYPLGSGDHSTKEKKAGWRKSLKDSGRYSHGERKKKKKELVVDAMTGELKNDKNLREAATRKFRMEHNYLLKPIMDKIDRKREAEDHLVEMLNNFENIKKKESEEIDKTNNKDKEAVNKILSKKEMREKLDKDFPTLKKFSDIPLEDMEMYWLNEVESQSDLSPEEFKKMYPKTYSNLQNEVEIKSGDWYNSKGVTKEFQENRDKNKQIINRMNKSIADHEYDKLYEEHRKLDDDLLGIVLKDLGYEDTKRNRAWIRPVVIWD